MEIFLVDSNGALLGSLDATGHYEPAEKLENSLGAETVPDFAEVLKRECVPTV
jgi:hypothetical protein